MENSIEEILNHAWSCVLSEISLGYTGNAHYSVRVSKSNFPYLLRSILRDIDELRW